MVARTFARAFVLAALLLLSLSRASQAPAAFPDVPPSDPAYTAVIGLAAKGALDGFDDGTFRPESPMSRAEFAKVITGAVCRNLDAQAELPFGDLPPAAVAAPDILRGTAQAFAAGLMRGTSSTMFAPDSPIKLAHANPWVSLTRAEAAGLVWAIVVEFG